MVSFHQLYSCVKQALLFYRIVPFSRLLAKSIVFPFEYYGVRRKISFPLAINYLITSRCNLRCAMCNYGNCLNAKNECELTCDEIEAFFRRTNRIKYNVCLSGGEPFMRPDILDIVAIIKKYGLSCGICTNGTLLSDHAIRRLIELDISYLIFSLHGPREIHDAITGTQGAYDTVVATIRRCVQMRKRTRIIINCAVNEHNLSALAEVITTANEVGADVLRYEHLNFITSAERKTHDKVVAQCFADETISLCSFFIDTVSVPAQTYVDAIRQIEQGKKKSAIPVYGKPSLSPAEMYSWYSSVQTHKRVCHFIWNSLYVMPNGDVVPCQFVHYRLGNITGQRLEEIWNSERFYAFRARLRQGLLPGCMRCCKL